MSSFCPIHNHTEYSSLDGLSTTKEIARRCQDLGYQSVGITDHGTVAGHLDFARTMQEHDIKPIFGCELYHGTKERSELDKKRNQLHLIGGALTDEGLRNLWRLADSGATKDQFYHVPRVSWDALEKYSEGMFATSACMLSLVVSELREGKIDSLNRYLEIYKDNFFIELHCYPGDEQKQINLELAQIAEERGLPMTIATDAHYASPDQYEIHDAYMAIQVRDNIYMDPDDRKLWHPKALYIKSEEEIRQDLSYLPSGVVDEALQTNAMIADMSTADLPGVKRHLPLFVPRDCSWLTEEQKATSAEELFIDLVEAGLVERYGEDAPDEVWERAETELRVFLGADLEHYLLQTWDFCQYCDEKGIVRGPGRGSAGGSIIAYALRITDICPLYYDLKFERFYNAGREKGLPDIDNDFPREKRKDVKAYLAKRWGKDRVRSIGTITRFKPKSVADATWVGCGVTYRENEDLKKIFDRIPDLEIHGHETIGWDQEVDPGKTIYVMDHVGQAITNWVQSQPMDRQPILERWIEILRVVCTRVEQYGVHPSGVVVSDTDLPGELPCRWAVTPQIPVTMFAMRDVEKLQYVKQDILGLRNLDTLQEWENMVEQDIEWSGLERKDHPEDMWKMLDRGLALGVFQIEDGYARRLCKEIQPRSIADLGAIVAMNRPGPMRAGVPDRYIARRFGLEPVTYLHPLLEPILEETYGEFLYQEQIIDFMTAIGYDLSDADAVRSILGKKKPEAMRDLGRGEGEWQGKGYRDMAKAAGIDERTTQALWEQLEGFASYSFNKSHAYEYAILAFRTLYAKYMATPEFIIALINTNPKQAGKYVAEGRRMGITVLAPDIDRSGVHTTVENGDIVFGFSNIKHIGVQTAEYICKLRDGHDITSPEKLYEVLEAEAKTWKDADTDKRSKKSPKMKLKANLLNFMYNAGCWDNYEDRNLNLPKQQAYEKELLQVILSDNSEEIFSNNQDALEECDEYSDQLNGVAVLRLPGVITGIEEKRTKARREAMGVITIEYLGEEAEFVVFPQQWNSYKFLWKERTPGVFELKKTEKGLNFTNGRKLT